MAQIEIEGMEFYAYHGCFAEERQIGTFFRVDMSINADTESAQISDNIDDTVNYLSVYQVVRAQMAIASNLLENVAERIAGAIINNFGRVLSVKVKLSKLNPPLGGKIEKVSVIIEKARQ